MNAERLLSHYEKIADAPDAMTRLRRFVLDLAVRGKLVPQDAGDEPASELLKRITKEKARLLKAGEIRNEKPLGEITEALPDLPSSWLWVRLGETGRIFNGNSVSESEKLELQKLANGHPFIATKDVGYGRDQIDYENGLRVPFADTNYKTARAGSVLICSEGGSAGKKIGITHRKICFGNKLYANETWSGIESRYIFYVYQSESFYQAFADRMTGIIGGIAKSEFLQIPIALPPLAEQRRIVAKVDELMALCDRLEAAQESREATRDRLTAASLARLNAPDPETFRVDARFALDALSALTTRTDQIAQLRKTILNLAVRGKLVEQDAADEPATDLLARIRDGAGNKTKRRDHVKPVREKVDKLFECPTGWVWTTVQQTLGRDREVSYGVIKLGVEPKNGGVPTLRCSDVRPGFIDLSGVRRVQESIEAEYARTRLLGGEVVINIRGTLGGVALVPNELAGFNVAREVAVVPIAGDFCGRFFVYLMLSSYFWNEIQKNLRGIAYKGLNLGILRDFPIPLPPLAEQHRIVAKVDELMGLCDRLEASLDTASTIRLRLLDALLAEALAPVGSGNAHFNKEVMAHDAA